MTIIRVFTYIIVPIIFALCATKSSGNFGFEYGGYPIEDCAEDPTYFGYCVDCETQIDCSYGIPTVNRTCSDTQACQVKSVYSACRDISEIPDCSCPKTGTLQKPDPYDNTKYIVCVDGDRHMFKCPDGAIYSNETETCYVSTTPFPSGCPSNVNTKIILNCTCFRFCFDDGGFADSCCPAGETFDETTENCKIFEFFTCTGEEDGKYQDNHNCSVYHTCVDEEIFSTEYCPENLVYNETAGTCEEGDCDEVPDCGVCPDDQTFFKIDCSSYYNCRENTKSSDPEFVPVPETCPEGSCFNEETGNCESEFVI